MPTAAAGDLDVYYELHGGGPLLALVMGLGVDHRAWLPHVEDLQRSFTCLIYDQRGVGGTTDRATGARPSPPFSIEGFAADLAGLLDQLALRPAHVCGVSMGGTIAMVLAAERPDLVRSLALHATWHRTDAFLRAIFEFREPILRRLGPAALQHYVSLFAWAPTSWASGIAATPADLTGALISGSDTAAWSEEETAGYLGHLRAAIEHDATGRLGRIQAPTLVTVGDQDVLTERRFADALVTGIPRAELQVLPGVGHAHCFEEPERFRDLTRAWVARHESAG